MKSGKVSIVIPCYNEERRLEPTLSLSLDWISARMRAPFEMILVNDGSTDRTRDVLERVKKKYSSLAIEIVSYPQNRGKGYAVKTGVLGAQGEKIAVMDADFSVELEEMLKFLEKLDQHDIVIGTKKHAFSQSDKHQKLTRRILGKGFTLLANVLLGIHFSDITCGLKAFRADVAKTIFARQRMERFSYDAEILFLAKRISCNIAELPIKWHHVEGGTVSALKETARSLKDLAAILFNKYTRKYEK